MLPRCRNCLGFLKQGICKFNQGAFLPAVLFLAATAKKIAKTTAINKVKFFITGGVKLLDKLCQNRMINNFLQVTFSPRNSAGE